MILTASWVEKWKDGLKSCQALQNMKENKVAEKALRKAVEQEKYYEINYLQGKNEGYLPEIQAPPKITDIISLEKAGITSEHLELISKPFVRVTTASKPWLIKGKVSSIMSSDFGGQLFQIASILYYANKFHKTPVLSRKPVLDFKLEISGVKNATNIDEQDYFKTFIAYDGDILLKGNFCSEAYFKDEKIFICESMLKALSYKGDRNESLGICHYVTSNNDKLRSIEFDSYFKPLLQNMKNLTGNIFIVSNNIEKTKKMFISYFKDNSNIKLVYMDYDAASMVELINCGNGIILSNSYFGWWAGYLRTYLDQKLGLPTTGIIEPTLWYKDKNMKEWADRLKVEGWVYI